MDVQPSLHLVGNASPRDVRRHGLEVLTAVEPPQRGSAVWTRIGWQCCGQCTAGVFCVDQVLLVEREGLAEAFGAVQWAVGEMLAPISGRHSARDAERIVPLVRQGPTERRALLRLAESLAAHPRSQLRW